MALFTRFSSDGKLSTKSLTSTNDDGMLRGCGGDDEQAVDVASKQNLSGSAKSSTTSRPKCRHCTQRSTCKVRNDHLCKDCAILLIGTRCHKHMVAPPTPSYGQVLVAVSGGDGSLTGLECASKIMDCGRKKRCWPDAAVVHVDLGGISALEGACADLKARTNSSSSVTSNSSTTIAASSSSETALFITKTSLQAGLHTYIVPIESFFADKLIAFAVPAPAITAPPVFKNSDLRAQQLQQKQKQMEEVEGKEGETEKAKVGQQESETRTSSSSSSSSSSTTPAITRTAPSPSIPPASSTAPAIRKLHDMTDEECNAKIQDLAKRLSVARSTPSVLGVALEKMNACINQCTSLDVRAQVVDMLVKVLLSRITAALGFQCLITCGTADRMTQRIMMSTFLGEGFSLPMDVAGVDTRFLIIPPALVSSSPPPTFSASKQSDDSSSAPSTTIATSGSSSSSSALTSTGLRNHVLGPWFASSSGDQQEKNHSMSSETAFTAELLVDPTAASTTSSIIIPLERIPSNWYNGTSPSQSTTAPSRSSTTTNTTDTTNRTPTYGGFIIARPFAEVQQLEVTLFTKYKKLVVDRPLRPSFITAAPARTSAAQIAMNVLVGLQASFPSTVHNVVRTTRKLAIPSMPIADNNNNHSESVPEHHDHEGRISLFSSPLTSLKLVASGQCALCAALLGPSEKPVTAVNVVKPLILCYRCQGLRVTAPLLFVGK